MNRFVIVALAGILAAWSVMAIAQHEPQRSLAGKGEEIARTVCANCHSIAPGQPATLVLQSPPRSFQDIANDPHTSAQSLSRFITTTHWDMQALPATMPDLMLIDEERDEVVAFILSLRNPALPPPPAPVRATTQDQRIDAGEELALRQCSFCHVVSSDTRYRPLLTHPAPSFQQIADDPNNTASSLRRYITSTHWDEGTTPMTMPNQMLGSEETTDVVSYVLSLRKAK